MNDRSDQTNVNSGEGREESRGIAANRDPSFTRVYADVSFANVIGDDIDIALLIRQTVFRDIIMGDEDQPEQARGAKTLIEVARLRMPTQSATFLAFNILYACAKEDLFDVESFDESITVVRKVAVEAEKSKKKKKSAK